MGFTIVKSIGERGQRKDRMVCCINGRHFWLKSFANGRVVVEPAAGDTIHLFADMIAGCFMSGSNFSKKLFEVYKNEKEVDKVRIIFNGRKYEFDAKGITQKKIVEECKKNNQ